MDPVTAEKVAARRRYGHVHHLHTAFRCAEALAAVCLLSWSSARLPSLARLSADLLRRLFAALLAPRFVFLLGNAIVLTLLAMSCRRPAHSAGGDIYDQFLASQRRATQSRPPPPSPPPPPRDAEEPPVRGEKARRAFRRSRSERAKRRRVEPDFRRSASELSRGEAEAEAEKKATLEEGEEDAEEFRQMVESFIATQLKRFHREESMDAGVFPTFSLRR